MYNLYFVTGFTHFYICELLVAWDFSFFFLDVYLPLKHLGSFCSGATINSDMNIILYYIYFPLMTYFWLVNIES